MICITIIGRILCKSITVHCNDIITSYCFIDDYINLPAENSLYIINPNRYYRPIETMVEIKPTQRSYIASIESIFENFPELERLFISNSLNEMPTFQFMAINLNLINFRDNHILHLSRFAIDGAQSLEEIHLNRNKIKSVDDYAFSDLNHLHTIRMEENELTLITNLTFAGANRLRVINLKKNHITALKDGCFALEYLEDLNLAYNQLDMLNDSIFVGAKHLKKVSFAHNHIKLINLNVMVHAAPVEWLNLEDNQIGMFENQSINCAMEANQHLNYLNLAQNQLKGSTILDGLKCLQNLKKLNLNKNNFTHLDNVVYLKVYFPHLGIILLVDNKLQCDWLKKTAFDTSLIYTMSGRKYNVNRIACIS